MQINDRRIQFLYQSWRSGSMRAASEVLDVAPSSISRQIAQLESEIGTAMIEHGRREIRLTDAGKRVIEYYMDQLSNQEAMRNDLLDLTGKRTGRVQIALGEGFLGDALFSTMEAFQQQYPGFTLSVRVTDTTDLLRLLAEDKVHFGLAFHPPSDPQILSQYRATVPLKAILNKNNPLANRASISIAELAGQRLALMDEGFRIRQMLDLVATEAGEILSPVLTTNSIAMLVRSACADRTVTILPEFSARAELDSGILVAVPIEAERLQSLYLHIVTRQRRQLSSVVLLLMQQMRARLGPLANESV